MDEYLEILASLSVPENYQPLDRYNDFRSVLLGTEEGRRVLKQILAWGHLLRTPMSGNPIDPLRMALWVGERNLALKLFSVMLVEPPSRKPRRQSVANEET